MAGATFRDSAPVSSWHVQHLVILPLHFFGSNSSGSIVGHGLRVKPLRSPRVNGSVLCTSMGLISLMLCPGNG